jgi:hypothetical protein
MNEVLWMCDHCNKIASEGWVWLRGAEMNKAYDALLASDELDKKSNGVYSMADLMNLPEGGEWSITCSKCYKEDMERMNDYDISIDRISTVHDVLDWTLHLMKKNWFEYTNWEELVRGAIPAKLDA